MLYFKQGLVAAIASLVTAWVVGALIGYLSDPKNAEFAFGVLKALGVIASGAFYLHRHGAFDPIEGLASRTKRGALQFALGGGVIWGGLVIATGNLPVIWNDSPLVASLIAVAMPVWAAMSLLIPIWFGSWLFGRYLAGRNRRLNANV